MSWPEFVIIYNERIIAWHFFATFIIFFALLMSSLIAGYGYHITGPIFLAQLCILAPSGPMTIWAMNGGILGLCTLPICLLATLWNPDSGHLHLVCISVLSKVITGILSYFGVSLSQGWISWVVKPSYIILLGAYLYFKDDVAASKQGKISSSLKFHRLLHLLNSIAIMFSS